MRLEDFEWYRVCAALVLFLLLGFYTVVSISNWSSFSLQSFILSVWSLRLLVLLPLVLLAFKVQRSWVWALVLFPVFLCFLWQIASLELYAVQYRFFSFDELTDLFANSETRPLILAHVISWKLLFLGALFYGLYFSLAHGFKRLLNDKWGVGCVLSFVMLVLIGEYMASQVDITDNHAHPERLCVMPWSVLSYVTQGRPVAREGAAEKLWHNKHPGFWEEGEPDFADLLAPQYKNRSIVVVLLESHGVTYIDEFGKGSDGYKPSSPYVYKLAQENVHFSNYFQAGYATVSGEWCILSSFPYFTDFAFTPRLARLGLIPSFQKHGYQCEWLRSATPLFGNLNELLGHLDISAGPSDAEKLRQKERDDSLWTAWGMPDNQLYEIAIEHIQQDLKNGDKPFLKFILTVSNHNPFLVPDELNGVPLKRSHNGGMLYADACLEQFMKQIQSIEVSKRPIVFITADTAFRSGQSFNVAKGLAGEPLESLRMPGILVLPEPPEQGRQIDALFSHEDLLPFLAEITGVESAFSERLRSYRRVALPISDYEGHTIITADHEFYASRSLMAIEDYWKLSPLEKDHVAFAAMRGRAQWMNELRESIWINANDRALQPDLRWDVIDDYEVQPREGPILQPKATPSSSEVAP